MTAPASGRTQAPYDLLKSRDALIEAAKLNFEALVVTKMDVESNVEYQRLVAHAANLAQVAQSLATYALAVDRWSP
jgi:hypothetical protein